VVVDGRTLAPGHASVIAVTALEHHLAGSHATMEQVAEALSVALRQPVVDQTGLTGAYDFDMKFPREQDAENTAGNPLIRTALQQTLGLRVEAGRVPLQVLVIDRLGKLSEN